MNLVKSIIKFPIIIILVILQIFTKLNSRLKLEYIRRFRHDIINIFAENIVKPSLNKVLIVITHVVSLEEAKSPVAGKLKIERLYNTIDGIQKSFTHCDTKIIINTIPEQHIIQFLPQHQRDIVSVKEHNIDDPMFVEFKAQDIFIEFIDEYDYFVFIEDDIAIHDSCLLDKIAVFNRYSCDKKLLLLPHRYEMFNGVKTYIDIAAAASQKCKWNSLSKIKVGNIEFAECENPHSAFYCLSKEQMKIWQLSGRNFYNKVTAIGSLESAATFCLFEVFTLYKPHPKNINFLEVQHWDDKYSKMYNLEGKHFSEIVM
jgi:hypothetical protein